MADKTQKNIRLCCIVALVLCALWAVFKTFVFIGFLTGWGGVSEKVDWTANVAMKISFFVLYLLSSVALITLCFVIVFNTLRGLREQVAFPQNNVKPLFCLALTNFVYMLCWINQPLLFQDGFVLGCTGSNFIMPFLLLFFAFMYKVAADAVEENSLTI